MLNEREVLELSLLMEVIRSAEWWRIERDRGDNDHIETITFHYAWIDGTMRICVGLDSVMLLAAEARVLAKEIYARAYHRCMRRPSLLDRVVDAVETFKALYAGPPILGPSILREAYGAWKAIREREAPCPVCNDSIAPCDACAPRSGVNVSFS
jgi:hypothetical protein